MSSTAPPLISPQPITIRDRLLQAVRQLKMVSDTPRLDAELLLIYVLDQRREWLITHDHESLTVEQSERYAALLTRRAEGVPIPYLVGKRSFYDRDFIVTAEVLIPRPETENLVEKALTWSRAWYHTQQQRLRVVDVGTGSGIIALTLAKHLPFADVVACDLSIAALEVAERNGSGLTNVRFVQSDLLASVEGTFDLVCANLPYIPTVEMLSLDVSRYEPHLALDGGADGLTPMRALIESSPARLNRPGLLLMEHGADQGSAMYKLARQAFPRDQVEILQDYGRLDRILLVQLD